MDVLADFLKTAGVTAQVDATPDVDSIWTQPRIASGKTNATARLRMLCVAGGEYALRDDRSTRPLMHGDVLFLLHDSPSRVERLLPDSKLITGSIIFQAGEMALATLKLAGATIVRGRENPESMELVVRLANEVVQARGGWEQVAVCLATSLFITALRASESCKTKESSGPGWLRALVDPEIGAALRLMHQAPEYRWTVAELANQLSISRSAFAERFKRITGRPPLEYLTWWRLQRAAARLRSGETATMYEAARGSGYQSEAAFSKAFRREFGMAPGAVRRLALAKNHTPSQLQLEIKKRNPFDSAEQEASLNLVKSFESVRRPFDELLSSHELSGAEYNILRVLRGTGSPMAPDEILTHLLVPHSDIDECLQHLVRKQLVTQATGTVLWEITKRGGSLLAKLDEPMMSLHRRQFAHFTTSEISELSRLLVKLRTPTL